MKSHKRPSSAKTKWNPSLEDEAADRPGHCGDDENEVIEVKADDKKRKRSDDESGQRTLKEMFSQMPPKRPKSENETAGQYGRCTVCRQVLDVAEIRLFEGDGEGAVDEFTALTEPRLNVFGDADSGDVMELPQHKLTLFSVYDKHTHLCPLDAGLIEKNVELYVSGYVKPIYAEDMSSNDGIAVHALGPIGSWWTTGFDGGEKAVVGITTPYADYVLMAPSDQYREFMDALQEKIYMSKIVIETLTRTNDCTYEDLLNQLEVTPPPQGIAKFTEDALLRNAQFVVDQVQSYDVTADDDEAVLIATPCMRSLINLAGVTLGQRRALRRGRREARHKKAGTGTLATTTPLVRDVFETLFKEQMGELVNIPSLRRKRCGVCEACQAPDCGKCKACSDMVKYGGTGKLKQCCEHRRCLNKSGSRG